MSHRRKFSPSGLARAGGDRLRRLAEAREGNVAMILALALVPMVLAVGLAIDYSKLIGTRSEVQNALDAATLAGARVVSSKEDEEVAKTVEAWIKKTYDGQYGSLEIDKVVVDREARKVSTRATLTIPTSFGSLIGLDAFTATVTTAAVAPDRAFMNVHLLLDNSASMGLAATTAGQTTMNSKVGCVFACHTDEGTSYKIGGTTHHTTFDAAQALGVTLRRDVMNTAAKKVISMIDTIDPKHDRIKVAVHYFNQDVTTVQSPTFDTAKATAALSSSQSQLGIDGTFFDKSLDTMKGIVGSAGDGSSAASPRKLVLMVTDGVQSQRSWVLTNVNWTCVAWSGGNCIKFKSAPHWDKIVPNKPDNCKAIKKNDVTFGVLYTEYLSIPLDWGYNGTVGNTMPASWGALNAAVAASIPRRDYLPYALTDCASPGYFMSANSTSEIESGLTTLFNKWISHLRLTQ